MQKFKYKLAENTIEKRSFKTIQVVLKDERLTMGNKTKGISKKFFQLLKIKKSVFVNSGSSANLLIAQSLLESGYLKIKQ